MVLCAAATTVHARLMVVDRASAISAGAAIAARLKDAMWLRSLRMLGAENVTPPAAVATADARLLAAARVSATTLQKRPCRRVCRTPLVCTFQTPTVTTTVNGGRAGAMAQLALQAAACTRRRQLV